MLLSAMLVVLLAAGRCTSAALLWGSGARPDGRGELVGRHQRTEHLSRNGLQIQDRSQSGPDGQHRDPHHKEKIIRHLTGPLSFNPKCKKHFHRLYHSTRDCTIPAYYKRCARLLTRLANSPRCAER